jgi:hypothetical protein
MEEGARLRVTVAAVRSQALDLLTELSHGRGRAGHDTVARLQRVANDLGWVFSQLPTDAAAPVADPLQGLDPAPSRHAAAALILGHLTVPAEATATDQAERWLRILRLHGRAGEAFRRVGIRERPIATVAEPAKGARTLGQHEVIASAANVARAAGASTTDTVHVLFAVRAVFGPSLDRALYAQGISWDQLTKQLVDEPVAPPVLSY